MSIPAIPKEPERVDAEVTPSADSLGLSLLAKLSFLGVVIGAVALFLRSRKRLIGGEKSLA